MYLKTEIIRRCPELGTCPDIGTFTLHIAKKDSQGELTRCVKITRFYFFILSFSLVDVLLILALHSQLDARGAQVTSGVALICSRRILRDTLARFLFFFFFITFSRQVSETIVYLHLIGTQYVGGGLVSEAVAKSTFASSMKTACRAFERQARHATSETSVGLSR